MTNTKPAVEVFRAENLGPNQFYQLIDICSKFWSIGNESFRKDLQEVEPQTKRVVHQLSIRTEILRRAASELNHIASFTKKKDRSFTGEVNSSNDDEFSNATNFIRMLYGVAIELTKSSGYLQDILHNIRPNTLLVSENKKIKLSNFEDLQHFKFELDINAPVLNRFVRAVMDLDRSDIILSEHIESIHKHLHEYFRMLQHRHTIEGVIIADSPILTDIALSIYSNIDSDGEIEQGKKPNEISRYATSKAKTMLDVVLCQEIFDLIDKPKKFIEWVESLSRDVYAVVNVLKTSLAPVIKAINNSVESEFASTVQQVKLEAASYDVKYMISKIQNLDPNNITFKEPNKVLSKEELWVAKFRNDTIDNLVAILKSKGSNTSSIIDFVLNRKAQLRSFFQDENSFFVCKISNGNPFLGEAPGELKVVPGIRPSGSIDHILGSGFDEVRSFFNSIEASAKWHDLFVASSPSKSADKSNILLVGPQGCGKTEVMRSVGADSKSISVFAQGSDFNTCWKGESEKNPKRLFEAGIRLQKESKKHVHFLIDEIDALLNNDKEFGGSNLTLEFQILMDGVVNYPNLSVWGATNSPHRIPMPMIRRFSKVLIVGELSQEDRSKLLKQFISQYLPTSGFNDDHWQAFSKRLEGATGDVIRKIADHLWREKMTDFTTSKPTAAAEILNWLNKSGPFRIEDFDSNSRETFKAMLRPHVWITPIEVEKTISSHLTNIAISSEIKTAVKTYQDAKSFLASFTKEKVSN